MVKAIVLFMCLCLTGCSPIWFKTVYVPDGQAVRLRETVKNRKVWVKEKDGSVVPGRVDLYDGWYCLPTEDK